MENENELVPSKLFTQIDWRITDSICEEGSILEERGKCVENFRPEYSMKKHACGNIYTEYAMEKLKRREKRASAHNVTSID